MKKKFSLSLLFIVLVLFVAQGGWPPSDIRLDTGDAPGANDSWFPQVDTNGSRVYAVWNDYRNGLQDIYFNYSTDGGTTWQPSDIRLDTGDTPGANESTNPKMCNNGTNVYVVWYDERNGFRDIYFNYSTDGGATWQASDIRLDTGDTPGANSSQAPQISNNGDNIYVVWYDGRNGGFDIYLNFSTDGGATWQASDIRLDTGDTPGTNSSFAPQLDVSGNYIYVAWEDYRNGGADIYFNYSANGGANWQASDIRLDTGDTPGASNSGKAQVCNSGSSVYIVWYDFRDGEADIYFNYSADSGATWQSSDIRLDTGDPAGATNSYSPQISCDGTNVYVAWYDYRNNLRPDIYFNCSTDGGSNWLVEAIRLDTGDAPGAGDSMSPQIKSSGNNVYVAWHDGRNGDDDIYFNCSTDGGMTWKTPDSRIDTGDAPGANDSISHHLACLENSVFIIWRDDRNGEDDIYFNTATIPGPDIKANGSDEPITMHRSDTLSITVAFDSGTFTGDDADWWLVARTPFGWYYYDPDLEWQSGRDVTLQIPLRNLPVREVMHVSGLPAGSYTFYFGVDLNKNGLINIKQAYYDSVKVIINP
ncbi:MAG: sialidase family protein [Candidatus Aminicenantes bacterium]